MPAVATPEVTLITELPGTSISSTARVTRYMLVRLVSRTRRHSARSRSALPADFPCYRHVGIYAHRCDFLLAYSGLARSPLEDFEALEQLRALWHGYPIAVTVRQDAPLPGVDTPEDLERARALFDRKEHKR